MPPTSVCPERFRSFNSFCSRPQQLSTYALTLYKHTATVGNKTVAVGMYCAIVLLTVSDCRTYIYPVENHLHQQGWFLFLIHRFLGHRWSGEISEHASLILPQSTCMHHGKNTHFVSRKSQFSKHLACPFSLLSRTLQLGRITSDCNKY